MWVECKNPPCQAKYVAISSDKAEWHTKGKITCGFCGESTAILLVTKYGAEAPREEKDA